MLGRLILITLLIAMNLSACAGMNQASLAPGTVSIKDDVGKDYLIGPGDQFQVFVWRNPDLSTTMRVRPDGRISVPLIDDLPVSGKTPSDVARDLEEKLSEYVKDVKVTIIMIDFVGPMERQVRVVGEAAKPQSLNYRRGMTVLDVMIAAGGLTPFAAGNRATIGRTVEGRPTTYRVRLADLLKDGDVTANVEVAPGDILTVPQSWF
jgi:polysaccharide export outer membrane protein